MNSLLRSHKFLDTLDTIYAQHYIEIQNGANQLGLEENDIVSRITESFGGPSYSE